jgi:hypothetical protein
MKVVQRALSITAVLAISSCAVAAANGGTGSVLFGTLSDSGLTVATDSRQTLFGGGHNDKECKTFAFGEHFVFAMAGLAVFKDTDAHMLARQIWMQESKRSVNPTILVADVSDLWTAAMKDKYDNPKIMRLLLPFGTPAVADAVFAANGGGSLAVRVISIRFDRELFERTGQVKLSLSAETEENHKIFYAGQVDVIEEFLKHETPRSERRAQEFAKALRGMPANERDAAFAKQFVQWSIEMSAHKDELAEPVDVVQLGNTGAVEWVALKPDCPKK